ncbi:hypothetical protein [Nocardia sp. NPDC056000]|uniref:hypothetical protein n=1 Tax=Nocardia sp. NPDC056000 TaxID=3345674 RepID=UPI0035E06FB5
MLQKLMTAGPAAWSGRNDKGEKTMRIFMSTAVIGAVAAAVIGSGASASASATPIVHTPCPRSEAMHPTWDVNTGKPVICVNTGVSGFMWVPDATR